MQRDDLLVWVDLEMTSIQDVLVDHITEIAMVLTDKDLNIVAELPPIIIHVDREFYRSRKRPEMQNLPLQDQLMEASSASTVTAAQAEQQLLDFLKQHVSPQSAPLCGNSIHMDKHFLRIQMRSLNDYLFYRCIDVSSIKELARRWAPALYEEAERRKGEKPHRARADILKSIEELKFYRENLFKM